MVLFGEDAHLLQDQAGRSVRRRGERSLASPGGLTGKDNLLLSLPAFGRNLYLSLRRDSSFLSDNFVIEERGRDKDAKVSQHLSKEQLCLYSGWVVNHTDSFASLNTCGGLVNNDSCSILSMN